MITKQLPPCLLLFMNRHESQEEHGHYYPAAQAVLDHIWKIKHLTMKTASTPWSLRQSSTLSTRFQCGIKYGSTALALNPQCADLRRVGWLPCWAGTVPKAVLLADQMVTDQAWSKIVFKVSYLREIFGDIDGAKKAMLMHIRQATLVRKKLHWPCIPMQKWNADAVWYNQEARMVYESILQERPNISFAILRVL